MKESSYNQQLSRAIFIYEEKLQEWSTIAKKYVPTYTAETLFDPKFGKVAEMIIPHEEHGFIYDPKTLETGIDAIMRVLIRKDYGSATPELIARLYTSFADAETRIAYLLPFIHHLNLYAAIGREVIEDLKAIALNLTDPEAIEINNNQIDYIEHQIGIKNNSKKTPQKYLE